MDEETRLNDCEEESSSAQSVPNEKTDTAVPDRHVVETTDNLNSAKAEGGDEPAANPPTTAEMPTTDDWKAADEDAIPESACVIDGSKLILHISAVGKPFQVDHGVKILFASAPLRRIERNLVFSTYIAEVEGTVVVIDAGGTGFKFVPLIPAVNGGVIYTRDGSVHVAVSGSAVMSRSRVSAPSLPTRVVNKFVTQSHFRPSLPEEESAGLGRSARAYMAQVYFPWSNLGAHCGEGGIVFVRTDESVFDFSLAQGTKSELHEGRAIAWSGDVNFSSAGGWFCFKKLNQLRGSGRIWIDNGRPALNPNVVLT